MTTFKDLDLYQEFIFASEADPRYHCSGMARGPWMRTSARCYKPVTDPFSADAVERDEHEFWSQRHNQVGSINVEVIPIN
jgi:hypothetical protein